MFEEDWLSSSNLGDIWGWKKGFSQERKPALKYDPVKEG